MKQFTIRILTPLLLIVTAIGWIVGGTGWMPLWAANIGRRLTLSEVTTAQLVIGVLFAWACSLLFFGGHSKIGSFLVRSALVTYAFCCVSTIASEMASMPADAGFTPFAAPAIALALALVLYLIVDRAKVGESAPPRRGAVWAGAGLLAVWVLAVGIAVRIPIEITSKSKQQSQNDDSIELDYRQWQGRTMPDIGLSRILPMLTPLTLEGRCIIVLYSPECSHCRELFEKYFTVARPNVKVIVIEIPPAPGTVALSGDNLGPMPCAECHKLVLPAGKLYILKPPTVVVTENGRVVCATDSDWKACLGEPMALPTPPANGQ